MNAPLESQQYNSQISPHAKIGQNVKIGSFVIIYDEAVIGDNVVIEAGTIIYENVHVGTDSFIGAQVILGERLNAARSDKTYRNPPLVIGAGSCIRSGTILYAGSSFGKNFQTGHRAIIRERSEFGDDCSVGTLSQCDGDVKVGNRSRFHNNVFIATHTTIEDDVNFFPMSCTTDSLHPPCQIGREGPHVESGAIIGAKVLLLPRVRIGAKAVVAGGAVVTADVPPEMVAAGSPAKILKKRDQVRCHIEDRPAYEVALESNRKNLEP